MLAGLLSAVKCEPCPSRKLRSPGKARGFAARLGVDFAEIASSSWVKHAAPPPGAAWPLGSLVLPIPSFPVLPYWFPPQVTAALAAIAHAAHQCDERHFERVALVALSAAIIAKWPNTLSSAMDIDHTRPHRRFQRITLDRVLSAYLGGRLDLLYRLPR